MKEGRPDVGALVTSYGELETRFNTKTEDLRKEIEAGLAKDRPKDAASYTLPKIKDVDEKELAEHPMIGWWREQAFEAGLPQARFAKAVETYIEKMQPQPVSDEVLKAQLGESFKTRIAAVDAWAKKTAKDESELDALGRIATDPAGIKVLERLAGLAGTGTGDGAPPPPEALTVEQLRAMQSDPRYWDAGRRDPEWVKKVEEGYKKLYPDKKAG